MNIVATIEFKTIPVRYAIKPEPKLKKFVFWDGLRKYLKHLKIYKNGKMVLINIFKYKKWFSFLVQILV